MAIDGNYKYFAFISYSHCDSQLASWLHRKLESYRVPAHLRRSGSEHDGEQARAADGAGVIPDRIYPVFRDREELPTSSELSEQIQLALQESRFLLVICSKKAAASHWVNEEIIRFKQFGSEERILCLIADGEPNVRDKGEEAAQECFPEALRYRIGEDGKLSSVRTEPIAADIRPGKDGRGDALLKILAGLIGVGFDDLKQRDLRRRHRRMAIVTAVSLGLMALTGMLAVLAVLARKEAEQQREVAVRTLANSDFLLGVLLLEEDRAADGMAHLARAVRVDPSHRAAADALLANLVYRNWPRPVSERVSWDAGEDARVAISGNGDLLAIASDGEPVRIYDRAAQEVVAVLDGESGRTGLQFHRSLDLLAVGPAWGSPEPKLRVYEGRSGKPVSGYLKPGFIDHQGVFDQAFSHDGKWFGIATGSSGALIWSLDGSGVEEFFHSELPTDTMAFSGDDSSLLLADSNRVRVAYFEDGKIVPGEAGSFNIGSPVSAAVLPGDEAVEAVIASWRGDLAVWELETGEAFGKPLNFADGVGELVLSEDEQSLLMLYGKNLRAVNASTLQAQGEPVIFGDGEQPVSVRLTTGDSDRAVVVGSTRSRGLWSQEWDTVGNPAMPQEYYLGTSIDEARFSEDGSGCIVRNDEGELSWLLCEPGIGFNAPKELWKGDRVSSVQGALLSSSGRYLLTVAADGTATLHDRSGNRDSVLSQPFPTPGSVAVSAGTFSGDDRRVFLSYADGSAEWRSVPAGVPEEDGLQLDEAPRLVATDSTGGLLAMALPGNIVQLYRGDALGEGMLAEISMDRQINDLLFDAGSELLVCATGSYGDEGGVHVFSTASGQPAFAPLSTPAGVHVVAMHPAGERLAVACYDGSLRVWEMASSSPLTPRLQSGGPALAVAFSDSGSAMHSLSTTGCLRRWQLPARANDPASKKLSDLAELICRRRLGERGLLRTLSNEQGDATSSDFLEPGSAGHGSGAGDARWLRWLLENPANRGPLPAFGDGDSR